MGYVCVVVINIKNNMKEELIDFETAKLAKEKEFNVNTKTSYDLLTKSKLTLYYVYGHYHCNDTCARPTQSLLQKWLREEHNIDIYVKPSYGGYYCSLEYDFSERSGSKILDLETTYEEALEKGLFEALELI